MPITPPPNDPLTTALASVTNALASDPELSQWIPADNWVSTDTQRHPNLAGYEIGDLPRAIVTVERDEPQQRLDNAAMAVRRTIRIVVDTGTEELAQGVGPLFYAMLRAFAVVGARIGQDLDPGIVGYSHLGADYVEPVGPEFPSELQRLGWQVQMRIEVHIEIKLDQMGL